MILLILCAFECRRKKQLTTYKVTRTERYLKRIALFRSSEKFIPKQEVRESESFPKAGAQRLKCVIWTGMFLRQVFGIFWNFNAKKRFESFDVDVEKY